MKDLVLAAIIIQVTIHASIISAILLLAYFASFSTPLAWLIGTFAFIGYALSVFSRFN